MIKKYREKFNSQFSSENYDQVKEILKDKSGIYTSFRLSESPIFLTADFKDKLLDASDSILDQIIDMPPETLQKAIPDNCRVPKDTIKPHFFTIDFGICKNLNGEIEPQLIELQAFPSLYAFQKAYENTFCQVYPFLDEIKSEMSDDEYVIHFKKLILGNENPENVILLEIYPRKTENRHRFFNNRKISRY